MPRKRITRRKAPEVRLARGIRVCLPVDTDRALRALRAEFGMSVSELVRAGVEHTLAEFVPKAVALIRDKSVPTRRRLRMMRFIRSAGITNLALHVPEVFPKPSRPSEPSA